MTCVFSDARIKSKFWGKSMEVFPIGTTHVTLPRYSLVTERLVIIYKLAVILFDQKKVHFTISVYFFIFYFSCRHDDHYTWQKVTSCIHNLLGGGQRWVDLYGEMIINNKDKCSCKLTFVKVCVCVCVFLPSPPPPPKKKKCLPP